MKIKKLVGVPFGLAGASIGMGIVGEQLGSTGLQEGGAAAGKFVPVAVNVATGGYVINQLRNLSPKKTQENKSSKIKILKKKIF